MFHAHNFYPEFLYRNGEKMKLRNVLDEKWRAARPEGSEMEGAGVAVQKIDYAPALLGEDVLRYIDEEAAKEGSFFLHYALNIPHANNEGGKEPDGIDGMEVPDLADFAEQDWPNAEKGFASMIRHIDRGIGAILDRIVELGIEKETIVFFSSDNGPHVEGGHTMEYFDSNRELRGMKRDLYEGGIRVPLIAWGPGRIATGGVSGHIAGFQDFLPTAVELAGAEVPEGGDGISFVPSLEGREEEQREHEFLYWEFLEKGGRQAVLAESWKGIRLDTGRNPAGPLELYRPREDPAEERNLAADHPEVVARLAAIMEREHVAKE